MKKRMISIAAAISMVFSMICGLGVNVSAAHLNFETGLETSQTQPTWTDTVEFSANVTGGACGVSTQQALSGSSSLKISGTDASATTSYSYFKVFNTDLAITATTTMTYYIYPVQDNGRYVGVDLHFTDGTWLRDSGALDQNGVSIHPAAGHGGAIPLNTWTPVWSPIGNYAAGKTVDRIIVAYDHGSGTGVFSSYIDQIDISRSSFSTGLETGEQQPDWTSSVEYSANVSSPTCAVVSNQQAHTGISSLKVTGTDNSATSSYCYFKSFNVNIAVTTATVLSYSIFAEQDNGRYVGVDLHFTDGTVLRELGATDQNGYNMSPSAGHGGATYLPLNTWTSVWSSIGYNAAGKTIDKILIGYEQAAGTGAISTYIDLIRINGSQVANIAALKSGTACQSNSTSESPAQALDGSLSSHWCATDGTGPHWLVVDLGQTYRLYEYKVYNAGSAGESASFNTANFKIQISNDGTTYTDIDTVTGNTANIVNRTLNDVGRYVRLYITQGEQTGQANQYARINEFELFGTLSAKIVTPVNSTEDIIIADRDVTEFGADKTGTNDSTTAIQNAINACYSSGGGTVWMPAGTYKVTGTITIPGFVTLRGDWRDPDAGSGSYGTVISAQVASGDAGPVLFQIAGSGGVMGLTTYYPNQSATSPVAYNYTFSIPASAWTGQAGTQLCSNIINVTMLNSYRGIGIGTVNTAAVHEMSNVRNIKGTVLFRGAVAYNSSDVSTWEKINFNNSYWANAGTSYNAPSIATLNSWTRTYGVAYTFGDLEFEYFYELHCSDYNTGIQIVSGSRTRFCGQFLYTDILNTTYAVVVNDLDTRWGMSFLRSNLSGSSYSVFNNTAGYVKVTDCILSGPTIGIVNIAAPWTSPATYGGGTVSKVSRAVLYDVTKPPYNASFNKTETGLPSTDATSAIQSALTDAGNAGGGVVYLPAGWYRINPHLTVPANVELRGSSSVPARDDLYLSYGTVLMAYEGKNTSIPDSATAFITLNGNTSGLSGLRVFYPENNPAGGTVAAYPYAVRANGANIYAVNVTLAGAYNGLDFATYTCNNHFIRKVMGTFYFTGINIGSATSGTIEGCLSNATFVTRLNYGISGWVTEANIVSAIIDPITRPNERFIISGSSNEMMLDNFCYGARFGIYVYAGNVNSFNFGTDNLYTYGYGIVNTGGAVNQMNYMRYNGFNAYGTVTFYNPMNL